MFFRQLTFDKKRLKILIMENLTKMKEIFNKLALITMFTGSVLSFNSCKERIHGGNPVEDQCVYCDDEKNDNSCVNGSECGHGYTDERLHTIGNGNYQFRNFMYETGFVDEKVASSLNDARSYRNVMLGNLNKSLEGNSESQAYFADYIANLGSVQFINRGSDQNPVDIDAPIVTLNEHHKPIMVNIIKKLDPLDRKHFIVYFQTLSNEAYRIGYGNQFNNSNEDYNKQKEFAQELWTNWNGNGKDFDITYDSNGLNRDSAIAITNNLDNLLDTAAANIGNGVTAENLRAVVNNSFIINSLDAIHDSTIQAHYLAGCMSLETKGTITDELIETARNLQTQEQSLQQTR